MVLMKVCKHKSVFCIRPVSSPKWNFHEYTLVHRIAQCQSNDGLHNKVIAEVLWVR